MILIFLIAGALVFGVFYACQGLQSFIVTGGLGVVEATNRAVIVNTVTAERVERSFALDDVTAPATTTPIPDCQDFIVSVPNAIVRDAPTQASAILTSYSQGAEVCVLQRANANPDSEWYAIDTNPGTRRPDLAYMHETVIEAVNPTGTPTITVTPLPTVTITPSYTPSITVSPRPTETRDPAITNTPTPTQTPSETPIRQAA